MTVLTKRPASVAMLVVAIAAFCALLLALPGQTVTTKYLNDLFIFLDGVHRVMEGQVPNRDFHTALGPLVYYAPALGYWLSGNLGGAMPVGMALILLALAPAAAHIVSSRLRPAIALPLAVFVILVAAVPINLGESISALSFAMFYNRIGWSALALLLVLYLRPSQPSRYQALLDAASAALLIVLMLYIKISYGVVGLGFLVFMLLDPRQRGWVAAALVLVLGAGLLIEALWGGTAAHIADLAIAGRVSGSLDTIDELFTALSRNLSDYVIFAVVVGLALWRTRSVRDFLFYSFCGGSGFMLITQNFQTWGIISLAAGVAVAVEMLARADGPAADRHRRTLTAGAQLLLLAFILPASFQHAAALGLHAALASTKQGLAAPMPNFDRVRLVQLWSEGDYPLFSRYFASLDDGAQALTSLEGPSGKVLVLDFVGPFSAGLGLKPPYGDSTWYHWGRTVNEENYLPAKTVLRDVQIVMDPKWPVEVSTAEGLRRLYADYLAEHFDLAQETADWKIYVLRGPPSETVSRSSGFDPDEERGDAAPSGG
jgi:hypothetical protein